LEFVGAHIATPRQHRAGVIVMATPAPWRDVVKICDNFEYMVRPETSPRVSRTTASAPPERRLPTADA